MSESVGGYTEYSGYRQDTVPEMEKLSLKNAPKNDHKSPAEIELERLERRLRTVQLAIEILTGVSATLPDAEPEVEEEEAAHDGMRLY